MSSVIKSIKSEKLNLWRDAFVAVVVGLVLLAGQAAIDDRRSDREAENSRVMADEADRRENLRFVRERSAGESTERPFDNMDLIRQNLAQLNMAKASFENAKLTGAFMPGANLTGANLRTANLSRAFLGNATLINADLLGADLRGAKLVDAKLEGATIIACYDRATEWPAGFVPPASEPSFCHLHDEVERSAGDSS